jgi:uncharacterized membrane protein YgdD (TMEM256/DUF423 family)
MNAKNWIILACILGSLSVVLGAFGAHAFHAYLENYGRINTYETAIKYQFYHVIAILTISILSYLSKNHAILIANWFFLTGIMVFCGTLYLLCLTQILWFGAITPIGGLLFIIGWLLAGWKVNKSF